MYSRANRCFGRFETTASKEAGFLPSKEMEVTHGVEFAAGVPSLADAKISWSDVSHVTISYEDVELLSAEVAGLKSAFKADDPACGVLSDVVGEKIADVPEGAKLFVVVGTVVRARRAVEIELKSDFQVSVEASQLQSLIGKTITENVGFAIAPPDIKVAVSGGRTVLERITYRTVDPIEVAFAPAFIPGLLKKGLAGPDAPANRADVEGIEWTGASPDSLAHDAVLEDQLSDALDVFGAYVPN